MLLVGEGVAGRGAEGYARKRGSGRVSRGGALLVSSGGNNNSKQSYGSLAAFVENPCMIVLPTVELLRIADVELRRSLDVVLYS